MLTSSLYRSFDRCKLANLYRSFYKDPFNRIIYLVRSYLQLHPSFYRFRIALSKIKKGYVMSGYTLFIKYGNYIDTIYQLQNRSWYGCQ